MILSDESKIFKKFDLKREIRRQMTDFKLLECQKLYFKVFFHNKNTKQIDLINKEIEDIQNNILKYVLNVQEIVNKEVLSLKSEKNNLLLIKNNYENQLLRINNNLKSEVNLNSKHLKKLQEFFPNSNIQEINKVEGFHSKIKKILSSEIESAKKVIEAEIINVDDDIKQINIKIICANIKPTQNNLLILEPSNSKILLQTFTEK